MPETGNLRQALVPARPAAQPDPKRKKLLLGRSRRRLIEGLFAHLPQHIWTAIRLLVEVRDPVAVLRHQLHRTPLPGRRISFRNGAELALSSDRDDIATVLVVFLRGEYGRIPEGGTVVDIGANIGAFAVYAARQGAARVYSIEPSRESFDTLNENIRLNGAGGRIQAFRKVLAGQSGETVDFPVRSCSYNSIGDIENTKLEMEPVETTTLADFLESQGVGEVDLLKLDCEGAEKTIVLDSPDSVWSGILRVRMEYHGAYDRQLRERLESLGFRCTLHRHGAGECGNLWFVRQGLRGK